MQENSSKDLVCKRLLDFAEVESIIKRWILSTGLTDVSALQKGNCFWSAGMGISLPR